MAGFQAQSKKDCSNKQRVLLTQEIFNPIYYSVLRTLFQLLTYDVLPVMIPRCWMPKGKLNG
jgi:hypothetical protein